MPLLTENHSENCQLSFFRNDRGADEVFMALAPPENLSFSDSLKSLSAELRSVYGKHALTGHTLVFARFYLGNIDRRKEELLHSSLYGQLGSGAISIVQQPPVGARQLALFLYHIKGDDLKKEVLDIKDDGWKNGIKLADPDYQFLYTANFTAEGNDSYEQTDSIFTAYLALLSDHGMVFAHNAVRTWIFIKDIERHYSGMVGARRNRFKELGLNKHSHYIASTGIEARLKEESVLVQMDALAINGFKAEQAVNMEAPGYLCPTDDYGVTFERGTKLMFGDRNRCYISGTASIDKQGNIVHPNDVLLQTRRVLENIKALLEPHQADLRDMAHLIVYLRDFQQADAVKQIIREEVRENVPINTVQGSICRPGWLVEIEGVAIMDANNAYPDFFKRIT